MIDTKSSKAFGVCAVGLIAGVLSAGPAAANAPLKIGELEPVRIATSHPYPAGIGQNAATWTVRYPGATYIRVHFSEFDLAPSDWVEISGPDGLQLTRYSGRGPHDTGEFWAFLIHGDTATIRLHAQSGGGGGFEIDGYGRGTVEIGAPAPVIPSPTVPDSVCGTQDWRDAKCYESTRPDEYARARSAAREYIGCCSQCTAFKVSDSGQFLTNNHCASTASAVQSIQLQLEYQTPGCASGTAASTGSVFGSTLVRTDATLDYTLFTTTGNSSSVPCVELDPRVPPAGERLYIAGHPSGLPKKLSVESDLDGGDCKVGLAPCPGNDTTSDVCYYCDTAGGSSGSPVFSGTSHKVVALHHFGGCYNSGVRIDRIYGQISGLLGACTGGGGGNCGNGVIDAGEQCDGSDLGGATCTSLGFGGGTLACSTGCSYNASGCCRASGSSCTTGSDCCTGGCTGKKGRKTCR